MNISDVLQENEASLIGTIIGVSSRDEMRGFGLAGQAATLRVADFRMPLHQTAWTALLDLLLRGQAPNAANIFAELGKRGATDASIRYITDLRLNSVDTDDVREMVSLVLLASTLRRRYRFVSSMLDILTSAQEGKKPLWDAQSESAELIEQMTISETPDLTIRRSSEAVDGLTESIREQNERGRSLSGISTGIGTLDEFTGGWQAGALHLVGATTGVGKTSFAISCSIAAARAGERVLLLSLEMDEAAITRRLATAYARASFGSLVRMNEELRETALAGVRDLPISIVSQFGLTAMDIGGAARREASREGLSMLVVDHVQMLSWVGDPRVPRWKQIGESTRRLIELVDALRIPLVMTAQLNSPPPIKGKRAEPSADDIRESKEPHHACSVFVVVHQKRDQDGPTGETDLLIQKNRFGPVGRTRVSYEPAFGTFADDVDTRAEEARSAGTPEREPKSSSLWED